MGRAVPADALWSLWSQATDFGGMRFAFPPYVTFSKGKTYERHP